MFQLRFGRTARVFPPLVDRVVEKNNPDSDSNDAQQFLDSFTLIEREARDALTLAKVVQAYQADKDRGPCEIYSEGDSVWLTTWHRRDAYKKAGEKRAAKFFPRFDGPYDIVQAHPEFSSYTLDMPNHPNVFPSFHVEHLKRFIPNDPNLFPDRERPVATPVIVDGQVEYEIERILDSRRRGRGWQFLVRWVNQAPSEDRWLSYSSIKDCACLDSWVKSGGDGPLELLNSVS